MVFYISQFSEFANSGLSNEQIEAIKGDNGEVLVVPDRTDGIAPEVKLADFSDNILVITNSNPENAEQKNILNGFRDKIRVVNIDEK